MRSDYDDMLDRQVEDRAAQAEAFLATSQHPPIPLAVDGDLCPVLAPYANDWDLGGDAGDVREGLGWAWLTPEQIELVNRDMGPAYRVEHAADGTWVLIDPDEQNDLAEVDGRIAVGPWRWQAPDPGIEIR